MKYNHIYITICIFLFFTYGCNAQEQIEQGIEHMTVSPDDEFILFSYYSDEISSIYKLNIKNGEIIKLLSSGTNASYVNPHYSQNGQKIVFIGYDKGSISSNIFIANSDGTSIKQLTKDNQIITEAIFSYDNNSVYYIKANEYNKYSPIGIKAAHNFDIYNLELESGTDLKLTKFAAYEINHISIIEQGKFMMMVLSKGANSGINIFPLEYPDRLKALTPSNNPREGLYSGYKRPAYSDKLKTIAFTAPYELYIMNFYDRIAKKIFRSSGQIMQICFLEKQEKILFTLQGENIIKCMKLDGSNLTNISVNIR